MEAVAAARVPVICLLTGSGIGVDDGMRGGEHLRETQGYVDVLLARGWDLGPPSG